MRPIGIGGTGNFGSRIARTLRGESNIELIITGRHAGPVGERAGSTALDIESPKLRERLRALSPELVIHCAGPFQGQDYRVAQAALAAGAHYLDLADGRE